MQRATSKNMSKINLICFFYFLNVASRKFKIMYVVWILFLSDSIYIDHSSSTWLTIQPHPVLPSPTSSGSNAEAYIWPIPGMLISIWYMHVYKCMCVFMWPCAHMFSPTYMCMHVCIWTSLCFQCVSTREGPLCEDMHSPEPMWSWLGDRALGGKPQAGCPPPGEAETGSVSLASWQECHVRLNQQPPWNQDRWQLLLTLANEARRSITAEEIKLLWYSLLFPKTIWSLLCSMLCTSGWCLIDHLVY